MPDCPILWPTHCGNLQNENEKLHLQNENEILHQHIDTLNIGSKSIEGNNEKCKFYRGLTWETFLKLFTFLSVFVKPHAINKKCLPKDQLFMTLMKLRLGIPFEFIAYQTGLSSTSVVDLFWLLIELVHHRNWTFLSSSLNVIIFLLQFLAFFKQKFPNNMHYWLFGNFYWKTM